MGEKTKVMILWIEKGCRKPRAQGTATANCSAATIHQFATMAREGKGRLFIVQAYSAADARRVIQVYRAGQHDAIRSCYQALARKAGVDLLDAPYWDLTQMEVGSDGSIVLIGPDAVRAWAGHHEACGRWEDRIQRQGRVTVDQSRALHPSEVAF
jgi:hypothetical protein